MGQRISKSVFDLVSEVCETDSRRLCGSNLVDHFPEVGPLAVKCGALRQGPTKTSVPDRTNHECRSITAEWDPETNRYRYFSLHARGWVTVPKDDLLTWNLDIDWLLLWIAGEFDVSLRTSPKTLVENHLWYVGISRVGHHQVSVFFTRRLHLGKVYDQVVDALRTKSGHSPGILLTTSKWSVRNITFPGEHRVATLQSCLADDHSSARIDMAHVRNILGVRGTEDVGRILDYNQDFGWVRVHGKEFTFSGDKQKEVVGMLIRAWERGSPRLRTSMVLGSVNSTSRTLVKFFGARKEWQDLIEYGNGYCFLKV
jgi:hypothetical protein